MITAATFTKLQRINCEVTQKNLETFSKQFMTIFAIIYFFQSVTPTTEVVMKKV